MRRMRLSSRLTFCAMILLLYFISNLKADHVSALWVILAEEDCASCALIGTVSCATRTYRIDPCHNDLPVRCEARRRCSSYKTRRDTCDCIYRKSKFCFDIASGWNRWAFGCCTQDTRGKSSWFGFDLGILFWKPGPGRARSCRRRASGDTRNDGIRALPYPTAEWRVQGESGCAPKDLSSA